MRTDVQTGADARVDGPAPADFPAGVRLDDGLIPDEAVALALWNNAAFQVSVSELGFARADLLEAGMLTNPILSLLLPVGPKQLEAALKWPLEVLWQRPKRVAAAQLAADAAAERLVLVGLDPILMTALVTGLALVPIIAGGVPGHLHRAEPVPAPGDLLPARHAHLRTHRAVGRQLGPDNDSKKDAKLLYLKNLSSIRKSRPIGVCYTSGVRLVPHPIA